MKKSIFVCFVMVLMISASILFSCSKDQVTDPQPSKTYAKTIAGGFIMQNGDVTLKSAPTVGGHEFAVYKATILPAWTLVNGSEFLPGSAPALDWARPNSNPSWFNSDVYVTYCPVLPLRVTAIATEGGADTKYSYLGITDVTPNATSFPITVYGKRLGDVLTINTDALTALPGYTNMKFEVIYTARTIDVLGTSKTSPATTVDSWPVYKFTGAPTIVTLSLTADKDQNTRVVYDGLDAKITGTITINIHVDNIIITKTTPATEVGHGLAITLTTSKAGWYDSGVIGISDTDITIAPVEIPVN